MSSASNANCVGCVSLGPIRGPSFVPSLLAWAVVAAPSGGTPDLPDAGRQCRTVQTKPWMCTNGTNVLTTPSTNNFTPPSPLTGQIRTTLSSIFAIIPSHFVTTHLYWCLPRNLLVLFWRSLAFTRFDSSFHLHFSFFAFHLPLIRSRDDRTAGRAEHFIITVRYCLSIIIFFSSSFHLLALHQSGPTCPRNCTQKYIC